MTAKEITIEPVSRLEGHLGVHVKTSDDAKLYEYARSFGTMFRGWEIILKDREPADAIWITQRTCGVCPTPHGVAATMAVEMAYNAPPPPLGIALRNLIHGAEQLYDSPLGCLVLEGPDYSQVVVEKSNPTWWREAQGTSAPQEELHGYATIADIMVALNPISGELWRKSLEIEKMGRKMASLLGGKHPHVNTLVPGGVAKTITSSDCEQYAAMLSKNIAFAKEFIPVMDDLLNFLAEMGYDQCGARASNLLSYGSYEDVESYDAQYEHMSEWAAKRSVSPGAILDGKLLTHDLVEINVGIQEMVESSYFEDWDGLNMEKDPLGNPLTKYHPWNKQTKPKPGKYGEWDKKYSWCTSIRFHDWKNSGELHTVELGPIARMWATALAKLVPESTGNSVKFTLPEASVVPYRNSQEMEFEWKVPERPNNIERIRARAYYHAFTAYVMYSNVLKMLELVKEGKSEVWSKYKKRRDGVGVGMHEAMRGGVAHWLIMKNNKIHNYQIMAPSTWNAGPKLGEKDLSPYEEAIVGTPVTEEGEVTGLDVVRTVRSFDPCLACSIQVYRGDQRINTIHEV